jgi:hypothetical protein
LAARPSNKQTCDTYKAPLPSDLGCSRGAAPGSMKFFKYQSFRKA